MLKIYFISCNITCKINYLIKLKITGNLFNYLINIINDLKIYNIIFYVIS